ncbi:MAG: DUF4157 domain-containing protein [Acidobacteriota bacterium]
MRESLSSPFAAAEPRSISQSRPAQAAGERARPPRALAAGGLLLASVPAALPAAPSSGGGEPPPVQAKLTMDRPGDRFERAADAAAKAALAMPAPAPTSSISASAPGVSRSALGNPSSTPSVQRMCSKCAKALSGAGGELCPTCKAKLARGESLTAETGAPGVQREADSAASAGDVPATAASAIRGLSGGSPLPSSERAFFEPRYGVDLSPVRLHTGPPAASLASQLDARALTHRQHVVFGAGEYRPGTSSGRQLLAHELAHVVQQGAVSVGNGNAAPGVQRQPALVSPEAASSTPEVQRVKCDPDTKKIRADLEGQDLYFNHPLVIGKALGIHPGVAHGMCCAFCGCTIAGWRERYLNREVIKLHQQVSAAVDQGERVDLGLLKAINAQMTKVKSYAGCYEKVLQNLLPPSLAQAEQSYIFSPHSGGVGVVKLNPKVFMTYIRALGQLFGSVDNFNKWVAKQDDSSSNKKAVIGSMAALVFGYGKKKLEEIPRQMKSMDSSVHETAAMKLSHVLSFLRKHIDSLPSDNGNVEAFARDFIKRPDSMIMTRSGQFRIFEAKHPWLGFKKNGSLSLDVDVPGIRPKEDIPERREQLEAYRRIDSNTALLTEQTCGCNLLAAFGGELADTTNKNLLEALAKLRQKDAEKAAEKLKKETVEDLSGVASSSSGGNKSSFQEAPWP